MADIMAASRAQGLRVRLSTVGPLFRVTATRVGGDGDATLEVPDRPLFGLGIFLGAVTVRHGFDAGCVRADLLASNDTPRSHNKVSPLRTCLSVRCGCCLIGYTDG